MNLVSGAMKDDEKIHLNEETKKLILESVGHLDLIGLFIVVVLSRFGLWIFRGALFVLVV